jgi:hypothetical protein
MEIDFDDEIRALIVVASLPNSWDAMRIAVSSSAGKSKLKYENVQDMILSEEMHRRNSSKASSFGFALTSRQGVKNMVETLVKVVAQINNPRGGGVNRVDGKLLL